MCIAIICSQVCDVINFEIKVLCYLQSKKFHSLCYKINRDGSRDSATSKMESFVIIVNGWKPLTIITKHSILDVAAALDPPVINTFLQKTTTCTGLTQRKYSL